MLYSHEVLAFNLIFIPLVPIVKIRLRREDTLRVTDGWEDEVGLCHGAQSMVVFEIWTFILNDAMLIPSSEGRSHGPHCGVVPLLPK